MVLASFGGWGGVRAPDAHDAGRASGEEIGSAADAHDAGRAGGGVGAESGVWAVGDESVQLMLMMLGEFWGVGNETAQLMLMMLAGLGGLERSQGS